MSSENDQKTSKFLMPIQSKDTPMVDPSECPKVDGYFTTGTGAKTNHNGEVEMAVANCNGRQPLDSDDSPEDHVRTVSVGVAAVMLVAEMAGSGVLALPRALANTGWLGVVLILLLGLGVGLSGSRLGICWVILEKKFPQYRNACRTPYPAIGYHALGGPGKLLVLFAQNVTLVGVTTVFLILSGDLLQALLGTVAPTVFASHCTCTVLVGLLLIPLSWLGTPQDFCSKRCWAMILRPTSIIAMLTTVLAVIVVIVQLFIELPSFSDRHYGGAGFKSFFLGFGTILFSFGGASTFPTIQNDMKKRDRFPYSVAIAFCVLLVLYLPISTIGYGVVGADVPSNILRAVHGPAVMITKALVLLHLFTAYVILINPVTQGLEEAFKLPRKFSWKRCLIRTCLVISEIIIGLLIPDFGKILDLVGASTVTLTSFILPPICYLKLADDVDILTGDPIRSVPYIERVVLYIVLLVGLVGGSISTYSALSNLGTAPDHGNCFSIDAWVH